MLFFLIYILLPPHPLQFLIPSNLFIEFLLHLVDEIGAAGILAQFDGGVVAVTLLGVESEELVEGRGEHLQGSLAVVYTAHLAQPVNQLHKVEGVARPLQGLLCFASCAQRQGLCVHISRSCFFRQLYTACYDTAIRSRYMPV